MTYFSKFFGAEAGARSDGAIPVGAASGFRMPEGEHLGAPSEDVVETKPELRVRKVLIAFAASAAAQAVKAGLRSVKDSGVQSSFGAIHRAALGSALTSSLGAGGLSLAASFAVRAAVEACLRERSADGSEPASEESPEWVEIVLKRLIELGLHACAQRVLGK